MTGSKRKQWLLLLLLVAFPAVARATDAPIQTFMLHNGMQVVVVENHKVPAVSHMVWYRTGSADDPQGKSGLAHFLEHLMFKGTPDVPEGEFSRRVAKLGGVENAFTGPDFTAYFQKVSSDRLETVMAMESDRMQHLLIANPETVNKERDVVLEERRLRTDGNPDALLSEQMRAALFLHHPYGTPNIGWKHEIEGLTTEDAVNFYRHNYHPRNAILIVSGDITVEKLKPLAEKYYGHIPAGDVVVHNEEREPDPVAARRVELTHPNVKRPLFTRLYLAPSQITEMGLPHEDRLSFPLLVLSEALGGSNSARLYQSLVMEQKLATAVSSYYDDISRGPSMFGISATPADGVTVERLETAINREIKEVAAKGITADELLRAKRLLVAQATYAREGVQTMGYIVGQVVTAGLPVSYITDWERSIDSVTAGEVRKAAQAVLRKEGSVTGIALPEEK